MKIDRPLWAAGALLCPQQFQQQARWEAWSNERLAHLSTGASLGCPGGGV